MAGDKEIIEKLIHDKDCIPCRRLFNCIGKKKGANCVFFEPRKDGKNGR